MEERDPAPNPTGELFAAGAAGKGESFFFEGVASRFPMLQAMVPHPWLH